MKKNKLLIGLGTLIVVNLPLLATISCSRKTNQNLETITQPFYTDIKLFKDKWAHKSDFTIDNVKEFIQNNKNKIFHNLPENSSIKTVIPTYKTTEGTIDIEVIIQGQVYNKNGELINASEETKYTTQLFGFKTNNLTTNLSSTELSIKGINELETLLASDLENAENNSNLINNKALKTKIKNLVLNTFIGKTISEEDIEIVNTINKANDNLGTLEIKIKIKNSWTNGVEQNKEFDLKLTGFEINASTKISNFEIKNLIGDKIKNHYAIPYGKWNNQTSNSYSDSTELESDEKSNESFLKSELEKHVNSIFINEPKDVKIKDVKINKEYSIGSIVNGYDTAHGAIYIVVTLDKYYDENGKLIENNDEGKFYFKISGFKVDENITTHLDYKNLYKNGDSIDLEENNTNPTKQTKEDKKISTIKPSEWNTNENIEIIKKLIEDKIHGSNSTSNLPSTKNEKKFSNIKNKVYGDENWNKTHSIIGTPSIEIDSKQNAIIDDIKGTLVLEVTFKNIWWKNGVLVKEHKEKMRFSGFKPWDGEELNKPQYHPDLLVVNETIKQENGESKTKKVAVISNETFSDIDLADALLKQRKNISKNDDDNELISKLKNMIKEDIDELIIGLKKDSINESNITILWNSDKEEDWLKFTIKNGDEEFEFKLLGFLGENNSKVKTPSSQLIDDANATTEYENANNNGNRKNWFDIKWTTHQYTNNNGIKDPQFYGQYWFSLDITIKDSDITDIAKEPDKKRVFDLIKENTLSDYYLIYEDVHAIPYEIIKNTEKKEITLRFKNETWTSLSAFVSNDDEITFQTTEDDAYFLAVANLGSFNFNKIFTQDNDKVDLDKIIEDALHSSIFASEFVKDNYNQNGFIKIKGYDLSTDIDQYEFSYELNGEFKKLTFSQKSIVQTYQSKEINKNVFVKIQISLEDLPEEANIYVNLKGQEAKHLIKIYQTE